MAFTTAAIAEICRLDLQNLGIPAMASITDVKHLSSYNWIETPTPSIAVPGTRHPESPLEPLFRALYVANPSFDIRLIDVVIDRNNIRKLLSFIDPGLSRDALENFTINIEITKSTAIFCRNETATSRFIGPHEFRGFGHEFEKAYTTSQISGSIGHHRIISYRFGGLNFIVRHETDGYVDTETIVSSSNSKGLENDIHSSMLGSLSLLPTECYPKATCTGSKLTIKEEGRVVPLESTLEIKTRVFHKSLELQDIAPQLWVSQTPKLVRAYHDKGLFQGLEVEGVIAEIRRWEEDNQRNLTELAALVKKLLVMVKGCGGSAVVKYDDEGDKLVVGRIDGKRMLPEDLYSKWDDGKIRDAEAHTDYDAGAGRVVKLVEKGEIKADGKSIILGSGNTNTKPESAKADQES